MKSDHYYIPEKNNKQLVKNNIDNYFTFLLQNIEIFEIFL